MQLKEIYSNLCSMDKRNPLFNDIYEDYTAEELRGLKNKNCDCHNCFYGRDKLANELIKTQNIIEEIRGIRDN